MSLAFGGETFVVPRDGARLSTQLMKVLGVMLDGNEHTLGDLIQAAGGTAASVSARLRDLRKTQFGGHTVDRRYVNNGQWVYRMTVNDQ